MSVYKVKKRNGTIVTFDSSKITSAIQKAMKSEGIDNPQGIQSITEEVIHTLDKKFQDTIPSVENIQDEVEIILMKE